MGDDSSSTKMSPSFTTSLHPSSGLRRCMCDLSSPSVRLDGCSNLCFFATQAVAQSYGRGGGSSSSEKVFESDRLFKKKRSSLYSLASSERDLTTTIRVAIHVTPPIFHRLRHGHGYRRFSLSSIEKEINHHYLLHRGFDRRGMSSAMGNPGSKKTATIGIGKSVSGMAFWLSPLVRAKTNSSSN